MKLKGLLAFGIRRARLLYHEYNEWRICGQKRLANTYWYRYDGLLKFLQLYYDLKPSSKKNLLERLVFDREVEV